LQLIFFPDFVMKANYLIFIKNELNYRISKNS
jgi:hypothetical protein